MVYRTLAVGMPAVEKGKIFNTGPYGELYEPQMADISVDNQKGLIFYT